MTVITKTLHLFWHRRVAVIVIGLFIAAGNYIAAVFFNGLDAMYGSEAASVNVFDVSILSFAPAGTLAVAGLAFLLEARKLGWEKSSIKRVLEAETVSCKTDLFYTVIYASNLVAVLGFIFTFGISYYLGVQIREQLGWGLLTGVNTLIVLVVLLFANSLVFYVFHRIAHTRFLWELHKTHHSATEMNIITNFRAHQLEKGLLGVCYALPPALFGVSPVVAILYAAFSGFIVLMQHADMDWNLPFIEKYIFIGAAEHRIHHSLDRKHQGKNLGYLVFWDWLFGTLHRQEGARITIGIDDDLHHVQNSGNIKTELLGIYLQTLRSFVHEVRITFGMAQEKQN